MSNPFDELNKQIKQKDDQIAKLKTELENVKDNRDEMVKKIKNLETKLEVAELNAVSESEYDKLKLENSKLHSKVNTLRRDERAKEKLNKIDKIINNGK